MKVKTVSNVTGVWANILLSLVVNINLVETKIIDSAGNEHILHVFKLYS